MRAQSSQFVRETASAGDDVCNRGEVIHNAAVVRDACPDDIPAMLEMGERFIALAWARVGVPYDAQTCEELLTGLIALPEGILLTDDGNTAMIGAMVHPWHFNKHVLTGTELFWWADEGSRSGMALKRECERRAREMGAVTFNMACQDHMARAPLERLYRRSGYMPSEHIYIKALH